MTKIAAGQELTASVLNDTEPDTFNTTGLTAATNFTATNFFGYQKHGLTTVHAVFQYTGGGITATSGNIADTAMGTLPSGYWPPEDRVATWSNGVIWGGLLISGSTGVITLRSANANITASGFIRFTETYLAAH